MEGNGESMTVSTGNVGGVANTVPDVSLGVDFEGAASQTPLRENTAETSDSVETNLLLENQSYDEFVHSEKSAHDKLVDLSQMEDDQETRKSETEPETKEPTQKLEKNEPTIEQKIMLLQAEALKLFAGNKEPNKKEAEELLKKLKELIESMRGSEKIVSSSVLSVLLGMFMLLSKAGEKGTEYMDEEVKRTNSKN